MKVSVYKLIIKSSIIVFFFFGVALPAVGNQKMFTNPPDYIYLQLPEVSHGPAVYPVDYDPCMVRLERGDTEAQKEQLPEEFAEGYGADYWHVIHDNTIIILPPDDVYIYDVDTNMESLIQVDIPFCIHSQIYTRSLYDNYPILTIKNTNSGEESKIIIDKQKIDAWRAQGKPKTRPLIVHAGDPEIPSGQNRDSDSLSLSFPYTLPSDYFITAADRLPLRSAAYELTLRVGRIVSNTVPMNVHILEGSPRILGVPVRGVHMPKEYFEAAGEYYLGNATSCCEKVNPREMKEEAIFFNTPGKITIDENEAPEDRLTVPIPLCGAVIQSSASFEINNYSPRPVIHILDKKTGEQRQASVYQPETKRRDAIPYEPFIEQDESLISAEGKWSLWSEGKPWSGGYFVYNASRYIYLPRASGEYQIWVTYDGLASPKKDVSIRFVPPGMDGSQ